MPWQVVSVPRMGISPLQWRTAAVHSTSPAWNDAHVFDFNWVGEYPTLRLEVGGDHCCRPGRGGIPPYAIRVQTSARDHLF